MDELHLTDITSSPPVVHVVRGAHVTIGRAPSCTISLRDPSLSRVHAELRRRDGTWTISDRDSHNGTRVNGVAIDAVVALAPGDRITLGDTVIVVAVSVPGAVAPAAAAELASTWDASSSDEPGPALVGRSPALLAVLDAIARVGPSDASVVITGENGTGKDIAARLLHRASPRAGGPFVVLNCPASGGALLESELFGVERGVATGVDARVGRLELAQEGTLFLDEVGDLEPAVQAKLLHFLPDRVIERVGGRKRIKLDVRIVSATNRDLEARVAEGTFRRDLFHRLCVVRLHLPPLRERTEDIPLLVEHFLARPGRGPRRLSDAAERLLLRYPYPGNVRELEHALESARLLAKGEVIEAEDLPESMSRGTTTAGPREESDNLYRRIVEDGGSFWELVRDPFLRRELSREVVLDLVDRAHSERGSYKGVANLFGIPKEHKRLLDFLNRHDLGRRSGTS